MTFLGSLIYTKVWGRFTSEVLWSTMTSKIRLLFSPLRSPSVASKGEGELHSDSQETTCWVISLWSSLSLSKASSVQHSARKTSHTFLCKWEETEGTVQFSSSPWPLWLSTGSYENAVVNLDPRSSDSCLSQDTTVREWWEEIYQICVPSNPSCEAASVWFKLLSITREGMVLKTDLKEKSQLAANNNRGICAEWDIYFVVIHRHCFGFFCIERGLNSVGLSFIWKRTDY